MWLLVDSSFLMYRAMHSFKDLTSEDMHTGVIYGFFEGLYSICNNPRFQSNKILMFADSRHSYRKRTFPDYKKNRHANKTDEEKEQLEIMHYQADILTKKILPDMGIPVYRQKGLESDDLIAWVSREIGKNLDEGTIITSDGDLYQCISCWINWYDPQRDLFYDRKKFEEVKGVDPVVWDVVKAIGGCTTDNVPGVRGVGEKSAIGFCNGTLKMGSAKDKLILRAYENKEIDKWKSLVKLPHEKTKKVKYREPEFNPEAFFKYCKKYDMDSYLTEKGKKRWMRLFKGKFKNKLRKRLI